MSLQLFTKRALVLASRSVVFCPGVERCCISWRGNPVIVGYHRILPKRQWKQYPCIHADIAVTPERFRSHMVFWKQYAMPVGMDAIAEGNFPDNAVAIGFDDFYPEVAEYAIPILEELNIPAILYICTNFADGDAFLWWYGTDAAVNTTDSLDVHFEDQHFCGSLKSPNQRLTMFRRLNHYCSQLDKRRQRAFLDCLGTTAHCLRPEALPTWDLVEQLARHPLISIGAHTLDHVPLLGRDANEVRRQMRESRTRIEARLGQPVRHFAYPFGGRAAAAEREYAMAAEEDFATAVTTEPGVNTSKQSRHALFRSVILQEHGCVMLRSLHSGWDNILRQMRKNIMIAFRR